MSLKSICQNVKHWCQRRTRGWDDTETYALDYEFVIWVNTRFMQYRRLARNTIDLTFYKYEYREKEWTQLELIDRVINLSYEYIAEYEYSHCDIEELTKIKNEIFDIFNLIFFQMGW